MERQISYYLMDPTKNMTILVETPVPEASFPFVAQKLMELVPEAEQVGFVRKGRDAFAGKGTAKEKGTTAIGHESCRNEEARIPVLNMAGGEFCGNASMSAAVYYAIQEEYERTGVAAENDACDNGMIGTAGGFEDNIDKTIKLRVSGATEPVEVKVKKQSASWRGRVHMPKPLSISDECFPDGSILPVVRFEGIAHVIIDGADVSVDVLKSDTALAEKLAASWCEHLHADAIGLMFLNETHDEMHPLVYVPAAGTCIWESSCASGTTAAGAYLAWKAGVAVRASDTVRYQLRQPGGVLEIEVTPQGEYYLMGTVTVRGRQEVLV